jgi:GNAT superfamily N-acetyltransferase
LSVDDISSPGNTVWIATDVRKIVGAYAVADYGKELSVVVVDKDYRGRGLGHQLVNAVVSELGSFYAEVSGSNLPSLKMMFSCGLVAYDAFVRPRDPGNVILRIKYPGPPAEVKAEKS